MKKKFKLKLTYLFGGGSLMIAIILFANASIVSAVGIPVSTYASGSNICVTPGQSLLFNTFYQQAKNTFDQNSSGFYFSDAAPAGYGGSGGTNQLADNTCYVADPTYPPSAYNNYAYYVFFHGFDTPRAIDYYFKYFYNAGTVTAINPSVFYSQIKNTSGGVINLRNGSSTSSSILKTLPQDWIVQVTSIANASGTPVTADGYNWYQVTDATDGVSGWMIGENASGTVTYLPYYPLKQSALQASSTDYIATSSRPDLIMKAIDDYFNASSTAYSLYSSDDGSNNISDLKSGGYEQKVILGIAARETGPFPYNFDNEWIAGDYGHGIMQITLAPGYPFDNRGYANTVTIPPCSLASSNYINCYTDQDTGYYNRRQYKPYADNPSDFTFKQYANTEQSIHSNIKDGMELLADKFNIYSDISSATTVNGTTYSAIERKILSATASYNGACGYLDDVADKLDTIDTYFPNATSSDISTLIQKMHVAGSSSICAQLHSPGELSIQDPNGRVVGVVKGGGYNEFPLAVYDKDKKFVKILAAEQIQYKFVVTGTAKGSYGLDITLRDNGKEDIFKSSNIAMLPNQVHVYKVNLNPETKKIKDVTLEIDREGDGVIDRTIYTGSTLGADVYNKEATSEEIEAFEIGDIPNEYVSIENNSLLPEGLVYSRDIVLKSPQDPKTTKSSVREYAKEKYNVFEKKNNLSNKHD